MSSTEVFPEESEVNGHVESEDASVEKRESISKDSPPVVAPKPKRSSTSGKT